MTQSELDEILEKHKKWLNKEEGGEKADLRGADLHEVNLSETDLSNVNLRGADLRGADLSKANLRLTDFRGADFTWVKLCGADLYRANFCGVDLSSVDFYKVDICEADLSGATYDEDTAFFDLCCPEKGAFIGFKKAGGKIIELLIPEDAKRSSAASRSCRCSKAKVLSITEIDGRNSDITKICSDHDETFIYKVGEEVSVPNFDENRWEECSTGIHFFITRNEAVRYNEN